MTRTIEVAVTGVVADHGTMVEFAGDGPWGPLRFVADHRPARDIVEALATGEVPICELPQYMIVGPSKWGET